LRVLDLFSGIGGFSLGLERAGMRTVAFCEIDPFCREILGKHWPSVPIYSDIRELSAQHLTANGIGIDVICGGFPCQDISLAGKGAGIDGARSGLWSEYARLIGEVRPRYVIVENVAALLARGIDRVLGNLAALGYDAEWHCIPAAAVGAPHRRDRLWIVAYPCGDQLRHEPGWLSGARGSDPSISGDDGEEGSLADPSGDRRAPKRQRSTPRYFDGSDQLQGWETCWLIEPDVGRVAHGVPARLDRLRALGNAVVPQIPEIIGRAIMMAESVPQPDTQ
jgi:DNA (cytosine-5)-methyltransferase 1